MSRPTTRHIARRVLLLVTAYAIVSCSAAVVLVLAGVDDAVRVALTSTRTLFVSAEWCWRWAHRAGGNAAQPGSQPV